MTSEKLRGMKFAVLAGLGFFVVVPAAAQIAMPKPPQARGVNVSEAQWDAIEQRQDRAEKAEGLTPAEGERRICRFMPEDTATRVGRKKLCLTKQQWQARQ